MLHAQGAGVQFGLVLQATHAFADLVKGGRDLVEGILGRQLVGQRLGDAQFERVAILYPAAEGLVVTALGWSRVSRAAFR